MRRRRRGGTEQLRRRGAPTEGVSRGRPTDSLSVLACFRKSGGVLRHKGRSPTHRRQFIESFFAEDVDDLSTFSGRRVVGATRLFAQGIENPSHFVKLSETRSKERRAPTPAVKRPFAST